MVDGVRLVHVLGCSTGEETEGGEDGRGRKQSIRKRRKRRREKEALLKEMTPSWFTECLHWAAVPLCLMLSGCQRHSQQHCLAAPTGKCVGLCSRLTLRLIRIDTGKGLSRAESRSDTVATRHTVIISWSVILIVPPQDGSVVQTQQRCHQIILLHPHLISATLGSELTHWSPL